MRSRRRGASAITPLLAAVALTLVPIASPAKAQPADGLTADLPPELSSHQRRVNAAAQAAVTLLREWFGPLPAGALVVSGVRWQDSNEVSSDPGRITVPIRWLAPVRDQSMERSLIRAVVTQYWQGSSPSRPFHDALVAYVANRAIHHILEGSNFAAPRFFGGHVSFPLRSLLLSPPVNDPKPRVIAIDALARAGTPELLRGVRALQSLERYAGWPMLLQAISGVRSAGPGAWTVASLASALSEARGTGMNFLVEECFRESVSFDYAVDAVQIRSIAPGQVESTITVRRRGTGRFAVTEGDEDHDPGLPVRARFADGREMRDFIDGAAASATLIYTAPVPVVSATVDPDVMLVLDDDRENNTSVRTIGRSKLGIRLALHWIAWLQNMMLTYTALA